MVLAQLALDQECFERRIIDNPALETFRLESISSATGSDHKRFRAQLGLIRNATSAIESDRKRLRAQLSLFRNGYESK